MRPFARLAEELESRSDDADRVAVLARWLRAAGRAEGALAGEWLVVGATPAGRPARLSLAALADAARALAGRSGMAGWLFDAGFAAAGEPADAIALLLPEAAPAEPATLAGWLAAWRAAAAQPVPERAAAVAAAIAAIDDAPARRWAVRAACGLARPLVTPWQWQRAWAQAFGLDARATAWHWTRGRERLLAPAALPGVEDAPPLPQPFAPVPPLPDEAHARWQGDWRRGDAEIEPRWPGLRVQVVRRGAEVAVWQRAGPLLNAALPATLLAPARWPDGAVLEAVLLAWADGRSAALDDALARRPRRHAPGPTLHLVLLDWHRWPDAAPDADAPARRARLHAHWPAPELVPAPLRLPEVFAAPRLARPDEAADGVHLPALAAAWHAAGWSGLVLRSRDGAAWSLRPVPRTLRTVLQYVPGDALAAAGGAAAALALLPCGFAVWNRAPRSPAEQADAMAASLSGQFLPPPADGGEALRLLPVARVPLELPADDLRRLHAWLRANAGQRFGGVHAVAPALVFELAFDATRASRRHRSGVVLERARVRAWLADAPPGAADTLDTLASPG